MSAQAGVAFVDIRGKFDALDAGIESALAKVTTKFGALGNISTSALVGTAAAIGAVGYGLYKLGASFDEANDTIRTGTGATGAELEKLEGNFRSVVSSVPASFGDAATAISRVKQQLQLTGPELEARTKQMLELSRITKTDLTGNTDASAQALNNWNITGKAQGDALDYLFRLTQKTGVGFSGLASDVAAGGAVARTAGLNFGQTAALVSIMNKNGIEAGPVWMSLGHAIKAATDLGRPAKDFLHETFETIRTGSDQIANQTAFDVFGSRAGPKFAALIREGKLGYDELALTVLGGTDTIRKAAKETDDFSEKWQLMKNKAMVAFRPIAEKVFDLLSKIGDVLLSLPDGSLPILAMGAAAAFAIPKLAGMAGGIVDIIRNGEGFSGFAQRAGLAIGGLSLGLGVVKPALDDLGVSATVSGGAIGAMTGIAFGPWGAAVGGVLGAIGGAFGLFGDKSRDELAKTNAAFKAFVDQAKGYGQDVVDSQGHVTDATITNALKQRDAYNPVVTKLAEVGVSWQTFSAAVGRLDSGSIVDLAAALHISTSDAAGLTAAMNGAWQQIDIAKDRAGKLAQVQGNVAASMALLNNAYDNAVPRLIGSSDLWVTQADKLSGLRSIFDDVIPRIKEQAASVLAQTGSVEASNLVLAVHRQRLVDTIAPYVGGAEAAKKLADQLLAIPKTVDPKLTLDMAAFVGAVALLKAQLIHIGSWWAAPAIGGGVGGASGGFSGGGAYVGATGAIVTRPTAAIIGEDGPEKLTPLDRAPGASALSGTSTEAPFQLIIEGDVYGMPDFERRVAAAVEKARRSGQNI